MDNLKTLLRTLDELISEHRHLLELTDQQRQALISGDDQVLQSLVGEIEKTVTRVVQAEERRATLTSQLAITFGLSPENLTADELVSKLDVVSARHMSQSAATLRELVIELVHQNERNRMLTEQSIAYMKHTIDTVAGVTKTDGYGRSRKQQASIRMFDVQA